jgi:hypothetical protein
MSVIVTLRVSGDHRGCARREPRSPGVLMFPGGPVLLLPCEAAAATAGSRAAERRRTAGWQLGGPFLDMALRPGGQYGTRLFMLELGLWDHHRGGRDDV